jgi:pimeloyl-ACP methyl ester carboxylesterase
MGGFRIRTVGHHGGMAELTSDLVVRRHGRPPGTAPTLLLLHGLTDSADGWADALERWKDGYAIVTVDQRGHGGSPRFTPQQLAAHPGEQMVDDAVALLEQLDRPVVVGHSLGGAVALDVGVRRPDLVRGLVLEDPAPLSPGESVHDPDRGREFLANLAPSRAVSDDEDLYRLRKGTHPDWPDSELLPTGKAEQQMDVRYLEHGEWKPLSVWPELFERLTVPTLVVSGDRADELCVDEAMEGGLSQIGNSAVTLTRVAGAGHCVRRDRTEGYHRVVDRWLEDLLSS